MANNGVQVTIDRVDEIMQALRTLSEEEVLIGVPQEKAHRKGEDPFSNAQIGYVNEYGSEAANIPPRPHLVPGVAAVQEQCAKLIGQGITAALTKADFGAMNKAFNQAGITAAASVKKFIISGQGFPPLAQGTLDERQRKGFKGTKPLIWTGQYLNSITYVIRKEAGNGPD